MRRFLLFALTNILVVSLAPAQVTHWRGPEGNGIYPDKNLLKEWPADGPKMVWHYDELGKGFSSAMVSGGKIYLTGTEGDQGFIYVLSMDGKLVNKWGYGKEFIESWPGARSSVTIAGDLLYMESGYGNLFCMSTKDGSIKWKKDFLKETDGKNITWGFTETVVIDGDVLYCTPGGPTQNVMALNRMTGATIWTSAGKGDLSAYCTPLVVKLPARKLLVTMTATNIIGLDAADGKLLWSHPQTNEWAVHANTPIYAEGGLLCFSGYGQGGPKLKLSPDGSSVTLDWFAKSFDSRMGGAVYVDGYVYGSGDTSGKEWQCLDWKTGTQMYAEKIAGKGNIITSEGMLYGYAENGEVVLAEPQPAGFRKAGSFQVPYGADQHWAHLVIAGGRLYVRHGTSLMVYDIRKK